MPFSAPISCARAFILAELAASVEWQLHCVLWPQRVAGELPALLLLVVYAALYGFLYLFERRRATAARLTIAPAAMLMAVVMAVTVFAVSNLSFVADGETTMNVFYIRTLVDFACADPERPARAAVGGCNLKTTARSRWSWARTACPAAAPTAAMT